MGSYHLSPSFLLEPPPSSLLTPHRLPAPCFQWSCFGSKIVACNQSSFFSSNVASPHSLQPNRSSLHSFRFHLLCTLFCHFFPSFPFPLPYITFCLGNKKKNQDGFSGVTLLKISNLVPMLTIPHNVLRVWLSFHRHNTDRKVPSPPITSSAVLCNQISLTCSSSQAYSADAESTGSQVK